MEKSFQWAGLQALQHPCTKGTGPAFRSACHCLAETTSLPHDGWGMADETSSPPGNAVYLHLLLQVSAVPTVLAIKNGDVVDKFVGIKDEDQLEAFLKKLIG